MHALCDPTLQGDLGEKFLQTYQLNWQFLIKIPIGYYLVNYLMLFIFNSMITWRIAVGECRLLPSEALWLHLHHHIFVWKRRPFATFMPAVQFENAADSVFILKLCGSILVQTGENGELWKWRTLKNDDADNHIWLPDAFCFVIFIKIFFTVQITLIHLCCASRRICFVTTAYAFSLVLI